MLAESTSYDSRFANKKHGDIIHVNQIYSYQDKLHKLDCLDEVETQKKLELLKKIKNTLKSIDSPVRIVVAGGFNAGKSTFLNALLGAEYMPTKAVRSTAIVNCLIAGNSKELIIYYYDGTLEKLPYESPEQLRTQVLERMKHESDLIEHIDIVCTEHAFLEKFTLIDTPGTDHSEKDSKISFREVKKADALIWVLHNEGIKKDDDTYISNFHKDNPDKPIIVIINQIDSLDDSELKSVLRTVKDKTADKVKKIFPISAKYAFTGHKDNDGLKFKKSRFSEVETYLRSELFGAYGELHKVKLHSSCMPVIEEIDDFLHYHEAMLSKRGTEHGAIKSTFLNKKSEILLKERIDKILGIL